uniref:HORMA domain-containing protein n=2 Tax=Oryza meridionalis TaxID=40149 RepID=A0A0E0EZD5_9ORYZ
MCLSSRILNGKTRYFSTLRSSHTENKCILSVPVSSLAHHHLPILLSRATVSGLLLKLPLVHSVLRSLSLGPTPSLSISFLSLLRCFASMTLDNYSLNIAISAAARLPSVVVGSQFHVLSLKLSLASDTFVLNALINMYSSCNYPASARLVLDSAPQGASDVVSWNTIIAGYIRGGMPNKALQSFHQMAKEQVRLDEVTLLNVLVACARTGAMKVGRLCHALVVLNGFEINCYIGSSLVSMYAKCGMVEEARRVFNRMPERNVVCWTSMIAGCTQSGRFKEAVDLFRDMQIAGVKADDATIATVVSSCGQMGALDLGRYLHAYCDGHGLGKELSVKNSLIDMYSKCGDVNKAYQIFRGLTKRDVFTWTVMIMGFAMNGLCVEALDLFAQMEGEDKVMPNEVIFLGVLTACSHGGLVEQGYHHFHRMSKVYNLVPRIEHYGCMVDLLGRAKLLAEAEQFIKDMPVTPDVVVWRSLLFACRASGQVRLAEYAAERIEQLEPKRCGGHVLLSNVYATTSRWVDVNNVRTGMDNSRTSKKPGCSFIEVDGCIHEFFAGDESHFETEAMNNTLFGINELLVAESFLTCVVFLKGFYPSRAFERRRYMNVVVQKAVHPQLAGYIHSATSGLLPFIQKGLVERVVVIFYDKAHVPVEKFVFKLAVNQSYGSKVEEANLEFALRAFLIKLTVAEPLTRPLPSDGSWEITAYFQSLPPDGEKEAQLWIPTDTKQWMQPPQITPIKSMSCDPVKMQLYLEQPSRTEPRDPPTEP